MDFTKYNFEDEDDFAIFKMMLRVIKGDKIMYSNLKKKKKYTFSKILKICYSSRNCHKSEDIQLNASYWLDDCGFVPSEISRLIYYTLLINYFDEKPSIGFIDRFDNCLKFILCNGSNLPHNCDANIVPFYDKIFNAMIKCGKEKNYIEEKIETLKLFLKASEYDLPL